MANPRFYWTSWEKGVPWMSGTITRTVDIDEPISDLQIRQTREVSDAITLSSMQHRNHKRPYLEVRVILERFTDPALARELYALESHLQKGGYVGFSADRSKTWASWLGGGTSPTGELVVAEGDKLLSVYGPARVGADSNSNLFKHYESTGLVSGGDIVALDGTIDNFHHEELEVDASGNTFSGTRSTGKLNTVATHAGGARYEYEQGSIVRYRDFWPYLSLPDNQVGKPIITHDHRVSWTFDATFRASLGWMAATQRQVDPFTPESIFDDSDRVGDPNLGQDPGRGGIIKIGEYIGIGDSLFDSIIKY